MKNRFIIIFFIIKFILLEIKRQLGSIIQIFKNLKDYNFFSYLNYLVFNKDIIFKNKDINIFLKKNYLVTKKENFKKTNNKKILVELLLPHHSEPMVMNCLIAKDFQKLYGSDIVGIINKNDLLNKRIAESFGINEFIYFNQNNFFKNIYYFFISLKIINLDEIENKLINLKFFGHEVGKAAMENYLRWHNHNMFTKDKFLLYLFLSQSILSTVESKKIFRNNYKIFVIGEIQFIPNKLLFHESLKSKTQVYCSFGTSIINFIGRLYNNYKDRNSVQLKLSQKFSKLLIKIFKNKKLLEEIKKNDGIKNIGKEIVWSDTKNIKTIKFKSKEYFNKYFNLDDKKKTVLILPHAMSDNLFNNEWNIFKTAYDWYYQTIKRIQSIKNINWLIKPHPYEYKFPGITARKIFDNFGYRGNNIKFFDEKLHINETYKYVDLVITGNGSAGYQYTSLGIPTITTSDTKYSNFKFTLAPKNKQEYFKMLKRVNKIRRPKNQKIKKAQIYWLSNLNILYNSHGLLPKIKQHGLFKKRIFFKKISKKKIIRYKANSFSDDLFTQIRNKNRHSINSSFYNKNKKRHNFKLNDI